MLLVQNINAATACTSLQKKTKEEQLCRHKAPFAVTRKASLNSVWKLFGAFYAIPNGRFFVYLLYQLRDW